MKKRKIIVFFLAAAMIFSACSDLLQTSSDRFLDTEDHHLGSANDSLYSVVGILGQLQKLGDRYVILGELRGELMDITENSGLDLQAIHHFTATPDNPWLSAKEYYAVINNCNYFLQHVDTTILSGGVKVMLKEYAVVKAIRAWTYLQLVLNFGKATYIEEPILTLEDVNKNYPVLELNELLDQLIADLEPYELVPYPAYGNIGLRNVQYSFIPVSFLLGDLYLWKGQYEAAARKYFGLIDRENRILEREYNSSWPNQLFMEGTQNYYWPDMFFLLRDEMLTIIPFSSEYGNNSVLLNMTMPLSANELYTYELAPSSVARTMWNNEMYTFTNRYNVPSPSTEATAFTYGDLRGEGSSYRSYIMDGDTVRCIYKYEASAVSENNSIIYTSVFLYRTATLYLHLAEALNHLQKPSLAFAVLKYGLKNETLTDPGRVSPEEITPLPDYCNFTAARFDNNASVRQRGLGYPAADSLFFVFPQDLHNLQDSIRFVDDMICKELALETAFEGNRFHDLMRFAYRRNEPAFLAEKVASKHAGSAIYDKLLDTKNWYLPSK